MLSRLQAIILVVYFWDACSFVSHQFLSSKTSPLALYGAQVIEEEQVLEEYEWKHYQTPSYSPLKQDFEKAGGILYRTSVFSSEECSIMHQEVSQLSQLLSKEATSSVAKNRIGAVLLPASKTVQLLKEGKLLDLVHRTAGPEYELAEDIPVEVRIYEKMGAGMEWHVDDILYDPPQVEVVYTLENNSDCITMWKESSPEENLVCAETDANSALILRAGGVSHCVTSLKHGGRAILKCAFRAKHAVKVDQPVQQFGATKSSKKSIKHQKRRRR